MDTATHEWVSRTAEEFAAHVRFDGDTWELPDGRTMTLHIEPDPDASIMDEQGEDVWCGRIEYVADRGYSDHRRRPDGFTGAAEVIDRDRWGQTWWEVPEDLRGDRMVDARQRVREMICNLLENGYNVVGVDVDGHEAWLGMVDTVGADIVAEVAGEALWEATVAAREQMAYKMGGVLLGV